MAFFQKLIILCLKYTEKSNEVGFNETLFETDDVFHYHLDLTVVENKYVLVDHHKDTMTDALVLLLMY